MILESWLSQFHHFHGWNLHRALLPKNLLNSQSSLPFVFGVCFFSAFFTSHRRQWARQKHRWWLWSGGGGSGCAAAAAAVVVYLLFAFPYQIYNVVFSFEPARAHTEEPGKKVNITRFSCMVYIFILSISCHFPVYGRSTTVCASTKTRIERNGRKSTNYYIKSAACMCVDVREILHLFPSTDNSQLYIPPYKYICYTYSCIFMFAVGFYARILDCVLSLLYCFIFIWASVQLVASSNSTDMIILHGSGVYCVEESVRLVAICWWFL